ncbi:MAG: pyrophosphatase, partial [Actinomycetota bacterium]
MAGFNPAIRLSDDAVEHRYIHVIGSSVFVDDRVGEEGWPLHFIGMLDDVAVWGVDVPHGEDPSYGAASDLYSYYGRATELDWLIAGRAVQ